MNQYLREASGHDFTAKDFRTWAGTILAAMALSEFEAFDSETQAKTKHRPSAIESVAQKLGNTPSVCRKCYSPPRGSRVVPRRDHAPDLEEEGGRGYGRFEDRSRPRRRRSWP